MDYEWQGMPGEGAMRSGAGGGGRAASPPRGALAGIRRDAKATVTGATPLPSGGAWSNCACCAALSPGGCVTLAN